MSKVFHLPDLGEGLPDAEIVEWHVKEGDKVHTDQLLVSMETAKAIVDVPSPREGTIQKLFGKTGDIIKTGASLVEFEEDLGGAAATVAGRIEVGKNVLTEAATGIKTEKITHGIKASPAVRALAKKLNIHLEKIKATGPFNSISAADVQNAHSAELKALGATVEPLRGVRRFMATNMVKSHQEIVPVTLLDDADIHHWKSGTDITVRVIRALEYACEMEPSLNSHFNGTSMERYIFDKVHLALAIDSDEGLFVPVIRDLTKLSDKKIRESVETYKHQVKTREISQDNLKGGTITLSNFGSLAGRYANPIIVPPMVAIIGTGKLREEVVAVKGKIAIHRCLPLSLTFDHRAVTGGEACRFLAAMITALEK